MNCEDCKITVPFSAHEGAMAHAERTEKRLWIVILLLIVMLVGTNCCWLWYESQFEEVVTQTIEADQDGEGTNIVGGGDVTYGAEG